MTSSNVLSCPSLFPQPTVPPSLSEVRAARRVEIRLLDAPRAEG